MAKTQKIEPVFEEKNEKMEELKSKYSSLSKELNELDYDTGLDSEHVSSLIDFFNNDANWNWEDCVGLVALHEIVTEKQNKLKEGETLFLKNSEISGILYFLQKQTGKGLLNNAIKISSFAKPLHECFKVIQDKYEPVKNIEMEIRALENGIEVFNAQNQEHETIQ